MRFSAANALAALSAATLAAGAPTDLGAPAPRDVAVRAWTPQPVTGSLKSVGARSELHQKREIITAIVTTAGTAAATAIVTKAVDAAAKLIGQIANFDNAREEFTKATVKAMSDANPDPQKFVATICYNMDYDLENPAGMDGLTSAKITSGPLNTDYDCFYMTAPNAFFSRGDGGFINLATMHSDKCTFDPATSDLRCP